MWYLRISHLITASAASAVVTVLCVAGVSRVAGWPTVAAAVGFFEVGVFALCSVLSALVAVAGVLLVTDMRDENAQAHAWQYLSRIPSVITEIPADVVAITPWPCAYTTEPHSEDLRTIFLTYRLALPFAEPGEVADAAKVAPIAANTIEREPPTAACVNSVARAALTHDSRVRETKTIAIGNQIRFAMVASKSNVNAESIRIQHLCRSVRVEPRLRRVANAGSWSSSHDQVMLASSWTACSKRSADVIVLAERCDRTNSQNNADQLGNATAPTQPACRGPPSGSADMSSAPKQGAFSNRQRPKIDVSMEPDALTVVDNLGDHVQVGVAELNVIETYLDDVLRDVFASIDAVHDDTTN
jgi:hypothetical protein